MNRELTIRISGQAGQGMQTIGSALGQVFKQSGYHLFANQDYMSRVRGGNNFFQLRISVDPIFSLREKADIVVALDKESVDLHKSFLNEAGVMIIDKKKFNLMDDHPGFFDVPLYDLAISAGASDIFINTVACGVILGITETGFGYLEQVIKNTFKDKGEEVVTKNISAAKSGYDFTQNNFKKIKFRLKAVSPQKNLLLNGNEAIALGALKAGCKFYTAYPMSPSTGILETIAHYSKLYNCLVEQAEDEIAAINMAIGASFSGARSMTASSGGGFALMVEGLSLAAMTETPVVVACVGRPAPATGFPTRTEQADLDFLISAGHGEFARVVYSPGTAQEAFYLTQKAFNLAEKYQIPVLIISDQHLADSYRDIEPLDLDKVKIQRYIISKEDSKTVSNYKRYQLSESGVSPRAIPSWIDDVIYADSDEHNEEGHITEDAGMRIKMVEKRYSKKMIALSRQIEAPGVYNVAEADLVLVGFGSTYGAIKEVCMLAGLGKLGFVHLSQVWPFPSLEINRILAGKKKIFTVENNAAGQLAKLIKRESDIKVSGSILRFDGRPFNLDYLSNEIKKRVK